MVATMLAARRGKHVSVGPVAQAVRMLVLAAGVCGLLRMGALEAGAYLGNQAFAIRGARPSSAATAPSVEATHPHHSSHLVGGAPLAQATAHTSGRTRMLATAMETDPGGIRVGVLVVKGMNVGNAYKEAFQKRNVTDNYFETEVPETSQLPLAAKFLAMSNTVDVIVASYLPIDQVDRDIELGRSLQTVALSTNVPIVPSPGSGNIDGTADTAEAMAEIRQQALFRGGTRGGVFYGIGADNKTDSGKKDKEKVYF
mmetsp:Transcript_24043/g.55520  ORF Transcript_24043/g.55520 Transcript_24043/m.55520 type:complete len:256 (-) Transcript_24043:154-921(-)